MSASTTTAAQTMINAVVDGMAQGWTFEQAKNMAIAAMIDQDPEAMRAWAAQMA